MRSAAMTVTIRGLATMALPMIVLATATFVSSGARS